MSATSPLKVGFVGLSVGGWASMITFPALRTERNARTYDLVAISTRSSGSAAEASKKYAEILEHEVKGYHGDPAQLVHDSNVDVVGVSVKTPDHAKVMKHVLEAGKPFFLEWPAGCGSGETKEFARLAEEKQLKHMVCLQDRYNPCVQKVSSRPITALF
jgi:predicted dehydrogenase